MKFDEMSLDERIKVLRNRIHEKEKDILEEKKLLQLYEKLKFVHETKPDELPTDLLNYIISYDQNKSTEKKEY